MRTDATLTAEEPQSTSRIFGPGYRLDAKGRQAAEDDRLSLVEQILDPLSRQRRELVQPGWRCLEVGAGRGSMAVWLAKQVGESGQVVATDIDLTYLKRLDIPNLEVRQHNILDDSLDALGPGSFDLVCSRLMLFWLAGKQERAIQRMVECLRPGGWLLDEDADWGTIAPVSPAHPFSARYHGAYRGGEWWTERGYDPTFGRKLSVLFERCGLENIRHEVTAEVVRGGSPWARWRQQTLEAIRGWELADQGLTEAREKEYKALIPRGLTSRSGSSPHSCTRAGVNVQSTNRRLHKNFDAPRLHDFATLCRLRLRRLSESTRLCSSLLNIQSF